MFTCKLVNYPLACINAKVALTQRLQGKYLRTFRSHRCNELRARVMLPGISPSDPTLLCREKYIIFIFDSVRRTKIRFDIIFVGWTQINSADLIPSYIRTRDFPTNCVKSLRKLTRERTSCPPLSSHFPSTQPSIRPSSRIPPFSLSSFFSIYPLFFLFVSFPLLLRSYRHGASSRAFARRVTVRRIPFMPSSSSRAQD